MIDLATEKLVALRDVPRQLPPRPTGRRLHISAVYRWIQHGVRGNRLECIRIGGTTYTSVEALQRFADGLSRRKPDPPLLANASTATRRKQIERATREVEALLGTARTRRPRGHDHPDGDPSPTR